MIKNDFNSTFRVHAKNSLSPLQRERDFVTAVYDHICKALGDNCIQIGSYPRFTSTTPLHDLDVLYILGDMSSFLENPSEILTRLQATLKDYFLKNTNYKVIISLQTHSVTVSFVDGTGKEDFGIDVVPAFVNGVNEFGLDMYVVPEIIKIKRSKRHSYYSEKKAENKAVQWVKSDPRGYIKIASNINEKNGDYRKTVKFIKKWKHNLAHKNEQVKLKSFHIEQIVVGIFQKNPDASMFDAVFEFFTKLPQHIEKPQIPDRANADVFIDAYLADLTDEQRALILQARDHFLIGLEEFTPSKSVHELLSADFYKRFSSTEAYLFDSYIPVLTEPQHTFKINGWVRKKPGFRHGWLSQIPWKLEYLRYIDFSVSQDNTQAHLYKWKVKNHNSSPQPRGEITDHRTSQSPESTRYSGAHYVECFAVKNNVCIARHRINVPIA